MKEGALVRTQRALLARQAGRTLVVCLYVGACLSVCLSAACLSVCLSACLSVCLSVCLSACLSVYRSVCLSVWRCDAVGRQTCGKG